MMDPLTRGFLIYAAGAIASVFALGLAVPRRNSPGGKWLVGFLIIHSVWMALNALEFTGLPIEVRIGIISLGSIIAAGPGLLFMFAIEYAQPSHRVSRNLLAVLAVVPAVLVALGLTNSLHGLLFESAILDPSGTGLLIVSYGPLYAVMVYLGAPVLLLTAGILMLTATRSSGAIRPQSVLIALGIIAQAAAYLYMMALPERPLEFQPAMGSVVLGLMIAVALYRSRLLQLVPIGWAEALSTFPDGFIITDTRDTIVEANPAAVRLVDYQKNPSLLGVTIDAAFTKWRCVGLPCRSGAFSEETIILDPVGVDSVPIGVQRWRLRDSKNEIIGSTYVIRDNSGAYWTKQQLSTIQESLESWNEDMRELERLLKKFG